MNMKTTVCLFAHPDDEAFGPGGTIALLSKTQDVYIICATKGEAGGLIDNLGEIRAEELRQSAKILGVKEVIFLDYLDGTLSNNLYHRIANDIEGHLKNFSAHTIITFEPRGVSGHIDHIVISMVANFLFDKLEFVEKLMLYCHDTDQMNVINTFFPTYFVYRPPGYSSSEIGERVDITNVYDMRKEAILCHKSQAHDLARVLTIMDKLPKEELFLVRQK